MRTVVIASFALLASVSGAQTVRFQVFQNDKPVGWATVSRILRADRGKQVVTTLQLGTRRVRTTSFYAADGATLSRQIEMLGPSDRVVGLSILRFGKDQVEIVKDDSGVRTARTVPTAQNVADDSENWFWKEKPKAGEKTLSQVFDPSTATWQIRTTEYVGPRDGGHLIIQTTDNQVVETILDDQGLPLRISTSSNMRMVRLIPKFDPGKNAA
ncbi:hypothetical protein BH11ARM2_BH11ARM2_32890 [soil metagenome]